MNRMKVTKASPQSLQPLSNLLRIILAPKPDWLAESILNSPVLAEHL